MSQSVIVRTPLEFNRIQNQSGAFIMVNANKIDRIMRNGSPWNIDYDALNNELLLNENKDFSYYDKQYYKVGKKYFYDVDDWDIHLSKILNPYSLENSTE